MDNTSEKKEPLSEKELVGKTIDEVEKFLDCEAVHFYGEEYIIVLKHYFFGIFQKRLHLYTCQNIVYDCYSRIDLG